MVRLVARLIYAIFEMLIQAVFLFRFVIGQEISSWMESIQFTLEQTYSGFQNLLVFEVSEKLSHTREKRQLCNQNTWNV